MIGLASDRGLEAMWQFIRDAGGWGMTSTLAAFATFAISLYEHIQDKPLSAYLLVAITVPLFWIGAFIAWNKKRREVEDEITRRPRPQIVITQCAGGHGYDGQLAFSIINPSVPAVNVRVNDVRIGDEMISFPPYPSVLAGIQQNLTGYIVGLTGRPATDIQALFERQSPEPGNVSATLQFAIHYTDVGGKNEWETSADFYYDYRKHLFVLLRQNIREVSVSNSNEERDPGNC
jgi:hypothetical protein